MTKQTWWIVFQAKPKLKIVFLWQSGSWNNSKKSYTIVQMRISCRNCCNWKNAANLNSFHIWNCHKNSNDSVETKCYYIIWLNMQIIIAIAFQLCICSSFDCKKNHSSISIRNLTNKWFVFIIVCQFKFSCCFRIISNKWYNFFFYYNYNVNVFYKLFICLSCIYV